MIYEMPLNCTLKSVKNGNFVLCIFYLINNVAPLNEPSAYTEHPPMSYLLQVTALARAVISPQARWGRPASKLKQLLAELTFLLCASKSHMRKYE